jgi:hypothetical protein
MISLTTEAQHWTKIFDLLHLKKGNLPLVLQPVFQIKKGESIKVIQRSQTTLLQAEILDKIWLKREGEGNVCMYNSSKDDNRPIEYIKKFIPPAEQVTISWGDNFIQLKTNDDEVYFPKPHVDDETPAGWLKESPVTVDEITNHHLKYTGKSGGEHKIETIFFVNSSEMVKAFNKAQWLNQRVFPMEMSQGTLKVHLGDPKESDKERGLPTIPVNYIQGEFEESYNDQLEHVFGNCDGEVKCYYNRLLFMQYEQEDILKLGVVITNVSTEESTDGRIGKDSEEAN